jgi:hypothetical protein
MALIRVRLGGKRLGYVRNNKAGSTTILNYLGQLLWDEKPTFPTGTIIQQHCGEDSYIGREQGFEVYHQELKECEIRIAVYRDPVEKIVSGFYYCLKQHSTMKNLNHFLDNYKEFLKINYIRIHCRTNTDLLGPDPNIYTHVWNSEEIDSKVLPFLEKLGGKRIQKTRHHGDHPPRVITKAQEAKAREVMAIDYQNGWCKELIPAKM